MKTLKELVQEKLEEAREKPVAIYFNPATEKAPKDS